MLNCRFFIIANCEKIKANALDAAQNTDISTEVSATADALVNKNLKNLTAETYNSNKKRKKSVESMYIFRVSLLIFILLYFYVNSYVYCS
jgi:hypothetical protein